MKPLIVLLLSFAIAMLTTKAISGKYDLALSGRIALSIMLVFTALAHFAFHKGMAMMLPPFVPFKLPIVYLTGIIEITAAIGLLVPAWRMITAWLLIVFFILVLPANVYAAIKHIDYQKATYDGAGANYLWFRVPLQLLFILWTYFSAIRH